MIRSERMDDGRTSRRQFLRWVGGGAVSVAAVLLLDACAAPPHYTIHLLPQNQMEPASLTIQRGSMVTWHNIGTRLQSVTCDPSKTTNSSYVNLPKEASPWDSGELYPGQSWSYRFDIPGTYLYFSRYQDVQSMTGVIQVRA